MQYDYPEYQPKVAIYQKLLKRSEQILLLFPGDSFANFVNHVFAQ